MRTPPSKRAFFNARKKANNKKNNQKNNAAGVDVHSRPRPRIPRLARLYAFPLALVYLSPSHASPSLALHPARVRTQCLFPMHATHLVHVHRPRERIPSFEPTQNRAWYASKPPVARRTPSTAHALNSSGIQSTVARQGTALACAQRQQRGGYVEFERCTSTFPRTLSLHLWHERTPPVAHALNRSGIHMR